MFILKQEHQEVIWCITFYFTCTLKCRLFLSLFLTETRPPPQKKTKPKNPATRMINHNTRIACMGNCACTKRRSDPIITSVENA